MIVVLPELPVMVTLPTWTLPPGIIQSNDRSIRDGRGVDGEADGLAAIGGIRAVVGQRGRCADQAVDHLRNLGRLAAGCVPSPP